MRKFYDHCVYDIDWMTTGIWCSSGLLARWWEHVDRL